MIAFRIGHIYQLLRLRPLSFGVSGYNKDSNRAKWTSTLGSMIPRDEDTPSMQALRQPYPLETSDLSIFEEASEDYTDSTLPPFGLSAVDGQFDTQDALPSLVREGLIDKAKSIREELVSMGLPIQPDEVYEMFEMVDLPRLRIGNEDFLQWWSLVPAFTQDRARITAYRDRFNKIILQLLKYPNDLPSMASFAKLAATKGYAHLLGVVVISQIVRYGSPEFSAEFMTDFVQADTACGRLTPEAYAYRHSHWYNIVVRTHALSGRPEVAAKELQACRAQRLIKLETFTYTLVIEECLRDNRRVDLAKKVEQWLAEDDPDSTILDREVVPNSRENIGFLPNVRVEKQADDIELVRRFVNRMSVRPVPAHTQVAQFVEDCLAEGRSGIIHRLSLLANELHARTSHAIPPFWTGRWTEGLMLSNLMKNQFRAVLEAYAGRFQLVGVPANHITKILEEDNYLPPKLRLLWPSHYALNMAIQAVVHLTKGKGWQSLEVLYRATILAYNRVAFPSSVPYLKGKFSDAALDDDPESWDSQSAQAFRMPPSRLPTMVIWHAFIRAFIEIDPSEGIRRAMEIMVHMREHKLEPDVRIWTLVIAAMSRLNKVQAVLQLLDTMETGEVMFPNLVTYTAVIRGFMICGNLRAAEQVKERLIDSGYRTGWNWKTDETLRVLERSVAQRPTTNNHSSRGFQFMRQKETGYSRTDSTSEAQESNILP